MRLKTLVVCSILAVAAIFGSNTTSARQSPSVKMKCFQGPCGSDGGYYWNGQFNAVRAVGFPKNGPVIISVKYPNGRPYTNYDEPAREYGVDGGIEYTNSNGQLTDLVWAANNGPNERVDPCGIYRIRFTFKVRGEITSYATKFRMKCLENTVVID